MNRFSFFILIALAFSTGNILTAQVAPVNHKTNAQPDEKITPIVTSGQKYNFHEASSLSGINLRTDKNTGNILLNFDQRLSETGTLFVKNTAGKILYSSLIVPGQEKQTDLINIGKLNPGLYSIEVKTPETTFWKKVRVKR